MGRDHRAAPRHTGLAIAGIAAIPFVSVTLAARLGDAASTTDPREALAAGVALLGGLVMGLLVRRLVVSVERGVRGAFHLLLAVAGRVERTTVDLLAGADRLAATVAAIPAPAFVPAEVGRRGPPVHVR